MPILQYSRFCLLIILIYSAGGHAHELVTHKSLQRQLILAEKGDTVRIPSGTYYMNKSLSLDNGEDIVIVGEGITNTILSFENQVEGAEGFKITGGNNIRLIDLSVIDSKGDAIKAQNIDNVSFIRVSTRWSGKPKKTNGAYGLYPVSCSNVMIDGCEAVGASDAGIYVGQSNNIIVKNSKAYNNVAGIEIENSTNADVFNNEAYNNTGGILVFDLPDLIKKKGGNVRVFENNIHDNNLTNFAPKGNIVASVPDGTGVMILATNNIELFDNQIINNKTSGTSIISYFMTENEIKDKDYYPYPNNIYIHGNTYSREPVKATSKGRMGKMFKFKLKFGKDVPHIIFDGIVDKDGIALCIKDNKNATFANIDAANGFKSINRDIEKYNCTHTSLPTINLSMNE